MKYALRMLVTVAAGLAAACTVQTVEQSTSTAAELVEKAGAPAPAWSDEAEPPLPAEPLTLETALVTAFSRNARVREAYARLGITQADLQQAARIANPALSLAWLDAGSSEKDRAGIVASFTDLLLLPSRRRLAEGEMRRVELAAAGGLVELAGEVATSWYTNAGAAENARVRADAADAAEISAELARRYRAAGNITELELKHHEMAAADARAAALHAEAEAAGARARLADLLGLESGGGWTTVTALPAPIDETLDAPAIAVSARERRLDLAALRQALATSEEALAVARRYAWLGSLDVGYEREKESDGTFRGPTLSLELPLFDQGQPERGRASAALAGARARQAALDLEVGNAVASAVARVVAERAIVERRREAWASSANATARTQERVTYMLTGVFELLDARFREYDAEAAWLGALSDYWIARSALAIAAGESPRPATTGPAPGIDAATGSRS